MTTLPLYALGDADLLAQCDWSSSSTHSPGGQHRNKSEGAVRLRHRPSGLVAQSESARDRTHNRIEALHRLRLRLACQIRGATERAWLEPFRQEHRLTIAVPHPSYPLVIAVALDALEQHQGELPAAAAALDLSTTQLARLLADDKEVRAAATSIRSRWGLPALRG